MQNQTQSGGSSGLVHLVTSDPGQRICEVTPELNRQRRLRTMKCGTITGARLHTQAMQAKNARHWAVFLTLTYRGVYDWHPRHISQFLHVLRQHLKRRGVSLRYVWTCELQKRGAPHYHVMVWLPYGLKLPKADRAGWWPHGMTQIEMARNPVGYIAKYASKGGTYDHDIPRGMRIHATGGLDKCDAVERRWWLFPTWVRKRFPEVSDVSRMPGGGICNRNTGELVASPYRLVKINGVITIVKVIEYGLE